MTVLWCRWCLRFDLCLPNLAPSFYHITRHPWRHQFIRLFKVTRWRILLGVKKTKQQQQRLGKLSSVVLMWSQLSGIPCSCNKHRAEIKLAEMRHNLVLAPMSYWTGKDNSVGSNSSLLSKSLMKWGMTTCYMSVRETN